MPQTDSTGDTKPGTTPTVTPQYNRHAPYHTTWSPATLAGTNNHSSQQAAIPALPYRRKPRFYVTTDIKPAVFSGVRAYMQLTQMYYHHAPEQHQHSTWETAIRKEEACIMPCEKHAVTK
jgi:hypothetical protein